MYSRSSKKRTKNGGTPIRWFVPTQVLGILTAWSIAAGEQMLRTLFLSTLTVAMLIPLLIGLEAGLTAVLIFEPFRGFLRRAQYIFLPYSTNEPIHLLSAIVTSCALILVMLRHRFEMFFQTPMAGYVSVLGVICCLQVFNPRQGGIQIGLTGLLFLGVPMAWFYFGQAADRTFVPRVLRLIVVLGLVSSAYGIYQMAAGYPWFELYWIENTDLYGSIAVYNVTRPLATFSSAEEWGRYLQIATIIAAGLGIYRGENQRRGIWFAAAAALAVMLIFTGQRTSIFGLLTGLGILFLTGARNLNAVVGRIALVVILLAFVVVFAKPVDRDSVFELEESDRFETMISHTAKGTIDPTSEGSLTVRLETWTKVITEDIPANPLGIGIGGRTAAANRDANDDRQAIDNYFLIFGLTAGVPAALLLVFIIARSLVFCVRGWSLTVPGSRESIYWRIMMALMATFILNNFFGTSFAIYSVAPIGWLLIGWVSKRYGELHQKPER